MATAEAAAADDGGPQMSAALCDLLKAEAEQQAAHHHAASAHDGAPAMATEPAQAQSHSSGDLDLGQLDITSSDVSLDGLDEQLDKFADHEVVRAILDQVHAHAVQLCDVLQEADHTSLAPSSTLACCRI